MIDVMNTNDLIHSVCFTPAHPHTEQEIADFARSKFKHCGERQMQCYFSQLFDLWEGGNISDELSDELRARRWEVAGFFESRFKHEPDRDTDHLTFWNREHKLISP